MKHLILFLAFWHFNSFAENEKTIKSSITDVTVYQQGAQISRKAYYNASSGVTQFIVNGISPQIDPKSIQVNGTGNIVILDSKYNIDYPKPVKTQPQTKNPKLERELNALNDSLFEIQFDLMTIQNKIDVLNQQKSILQNNGTIKGVGKVNDSIPLLKDALLFYAARMNDINQEMLTHSRQQQLINKTKTRIQNRVAEIRNYNSRTGQTNTTTEPPKHQIVVTVSANASTSGKLSISYLVNSAGWQPLYDIRSNSSKNSVDLTYKAHVYQNTGVDWKSTKLKLSTNNPYANKTKPTLSPFYVNYYTHINKNTGRGDKTNLTPQRYIPKPQSLKKDEYKITEDAEEDFAYDLDVKQAYNYTQIIEQLIDVEYAINLPYSIKSNNKQHMVLVRQESLKTNYKFYTVPKLDLSTFLIAEIANLDDLNLIAGNANIFHDGTYLGETYINTNTMSDTLLLSLGKEKQIQVKRTLLKNDSKTKIIGDKTVKTFAYLIELKNHKSSSASVNITDQIPITQQSEIEIEVEDISKGKLNEVTGLIDWNLKLKPKETKKIKLIYSVSYSKNKQTNLAQH